MLLFFLFLQLECKLELCFSIDDDLADRVKLECSNSNTANGQKSLALEKQIENSGMVDSAPSV